MKELDNKKWKFGFIFEIETQIKIHEAIKNSCELKIVNLNISIKINLNISLKIQVDIFLFFPDILKVIYRQSKF